MNHMKMDSLTYGVFGLYSLILASSVFGFKIPMEKMYYKFSDVIAAVLFISALYKLNTSNTATDKSKGMIYFMFMLGMLALLYLFNVKSSSSKWLIYDALVVGGILSCFTGEPFSLYFKQV